MVKSALGVRRRLSVLLVTLAAIAASTVGATGAASGAESEPAPPTTDVYASDLDWVSAQNGWGPVERDMSNGEKDAGDGSTITVDGNSYAKGLGVHAGSVIRYHLGGNCETFVSDIGVDDEVWYSGSVVFSVIADGATAAQSPVLTGSSDVARIEADIDGASYVDLVVNEGGDTIDYDHADWAGARFLCSGDGTAQPVGDLTAPTSDAWASDLGFVPHQNGWGPAERDMSNGEKEAGDGSTLHVNSYTFDKGLGVHADSRLRFYTGGKCDTFTAKVGIDEEVGGNGSVRFRVIADGYQVYASDRLTGYSFTRTVDARIAGAEFVDLVVDDAGDGIGQDHADWGDARFTCEEYPGTTFYNPPETLPAENGAIVRSEPSEFWLSPLKLTKVDAEVTRMMYRTTDRSGDPIAVTGQLIVPNAEWDGPGERPVVAYAAGTQGLGDQCAPSRQTTVGTEYEAPFITGLLLRGYAVAMTDYQGLGTPGTHTYMVREATGRAVLDSARAALNLPDTGLSPTAPIAIAGYSQGGEAAGAAAELAASYAPELGIIGVAAGGVPGDLEIVAQQLDGSLYVAFLGYAAKGLDAAYPTNLDDILNEKGRAWFDKLAEQCTIESVLTTALTDTSSLTVDGRPMREYITESPWAGPVSEQLLGDGRTPSVPTLVTHSKYDDVVPYEAGRGTARRWCDQGADVRFSGNVAPGHIAGALVSYAEMFGFLEKRIAGEAFSPNCSAF
ncbi:NPCBM/NEW2 domain-containing protein [Haloechinothrix halophila]|uniref:NPCBM/NEW2 domain-containing protein n=1 Tax=Haloechinothrix halophila TaxID=1069073 RepID=UPI00041702E1|nr:NPCBM/NEW2 domain-containing protein [Haloechinothrix halophila]